MVKLSEDWLTNGILDFEYKQYELLGYLKKIEYEFDNLKLYPYLSDLLHHYDELTNLKFIKKELKDKLPKELVGVNLSDSTLLFKETTPDSKYMVKLDDLIEFALIEFKNKIIMGKFIYDEVEKCIEILELTTNVNHTNNGFFIIHHDTIDVYQYQVSQLFVRNESKILKTKLVRNYPKDFQLTYNSIVTDLVEGSITNPSTFIIDSPIKYPIEETLLPIARRMLLKNFFNPKN